MINVTKIVTTGIIVIVVGLFVSAFIDSHLTNNQLTRDIRVARNASAELGKALERNNRTLGATAGRVRVYKASISKLNDEVERLSNLAEASQRIADASCGLIERAGDVGDGLQSATESVRDSLKLTREGRRIIDTYCEAFPINGSDTGLCSGRADWWRGYDPDLEQY